jgi:hypothetical protein
MKGQGLRGGGYVKSRKQKYIQTSNQPPKYQALSRVLEAAALDSAAQAVQRREKAAVAPWRMQGFRRCRYARPKQLQDSRRPFGQRLAEDCRAQTVQSVRRTGEKQSIGQRATGKGSRRPGCSRHFWRRAARRGRATSSRGAGVGWWDPLEVLSMIKARRHSPRQSTSTS